MRLTALTTVALTLGLGGGSAWAYFTSTGSGTGHATAGTALSVTVTAATPTTADLLPGGTGKLYFTLTNPNHFAVTFNQVASVGTITSSAPTGCAATFLTTASVPFTISPAVTVGAGATSGTQFVSGLVQLANNAPNACQGVAFTVVLTLSGQSS